MKLIAILPAALLLSAGCRSERTATETVDSAPDVAAVEFRGGNMRGGSPAEMLPRAVVYRTNGDYNDHVAVTLDATRTSLVSYPDPADVSDASSPVAVADGWLLDRRGGIGLNSAFLDWTYSEYSRLPVAPSPAEIMARIITDARVTAVEALPIPATEAIADPAAVDSLLPTAKIVGRMLQN